MSRFQTIPGPSRVHRSPDPRLQRPGTNSNLFQERKLNLILFHFKKVSSGVALAPVP